MHGPIKILHVFGKLDRGGAESRTMEIMRHIDRSRYQLDFCALTRLAGDLDDEVRACGGTVHHLPLGPGFPQRFKGLLTQHRFDVVHTHVHYSSGAIVRWAAQAGTPLRAVHFRSSHDGRSNTLRRRVQRALMRRWIDRHATHILAVSQSAMNSAWGGQWNADQRCQVIYNGLDTSDFGQIPGRGNVLGEFDLPLNCRLYIHVGNFREAKNHIKLVRVFSRLANVDSQARLLLVGGGGNAYEASVRREVSHLRIADRVVFAGRRRDVPRLLSAADMMVFPSRWEGLPGAVLEACAAGVPILSSDLPVIREMAPHFPLLRFLAIDRADEQWVQSIRALEREANRPGARLAAANSFANTPFRLNECIRAMASVWTQSSVASRAA